MWSQNSRARERNQAFVGFKLEIRVKELEFISKHVKEEHRIHRKGCFYLKHQKLKSILAREILTPETKFIPRNFSSIYCWGIKCNQTYLTRI